MAEINIEKMAQNVAKKVMQELRDNGVFIGRWIPVSERLPKKDGEYLCTIYDMDDKHEYMDISEIENGVWCYKPYILVKAWMPLPQPYDPQESEEV